MASSSPSASKINTRSLKRKIDGGGLLVSTMAASMRELEKLYGKKGRLDEEISNLKNRLTQLENEKAHVSNKLEYHLGKLADLQVLTVVMKPSMMCSICRCIMSDPIITMCSHEFCRGCISKWVRVSPSCPVCRAPVHKINSNRSTRTTLTNVENVAKRYFSAREMDSLNIFSSQQRYVDINNETGFIDFTIEYVDDDEEETGSTDSTRDEGDGQSVSGSNVSDSTQHRISTAFAEAHVNAAAASTSSATDTSQPISLHDLVDDEDEETVDGDPFSNLPNLWQVP